MLHDSLADVTMAEKSNVPKKSNVIPAVLIAARDSKLFVFYFVDSINKLVGGELFAWDCKTTIN